jgi:hypothetical protein
MEKSSLSAGGKTFQEEEAERQRIKREEDGEADSEKWRPPKKGKYLEVLRAPIARGGAGVFGHLREIGLSGYVQAVEKEERDVWVVVHIYHPVRLLCICVTATMAEGWSFRMSTAALWWTPNCHCWLGGIFTPNSSVYALVR